MTLILSPNPLHLIGADPIQNNSICYEIYGNWTGPRSLVTMSLAASKTTPHSLSEFYGYTHCAVSAPGLPALPVTLTSGAPQPFMTLVWGVGARATHYRLEYTITGLNGTWLPWSLRLATLPRTLSLNTNTGNVYYARVRSENCAGVSGWRNSNSIAT